MFYGCVIRSGRVRSTAGWPFSCSGIADINRSEPWDTPKAAK